MLIVIAVISAVGIPAFAAYSNYSSSQSANSAVSNVTNALQTAKSQALSVYLPTGCTSLTSYDFKIDTTKTYSVHAICSLGTADITVLTGTLPTGVLFTSSSDDISFAALTGAASVVNSNSLTFTMTPAKTFTITTGGAIQVQ